MSAPCWWCGSLGAALETELLQRDRGASEWKRCLACRACARRLRPELLATGQAAREEALADMRRASDELRTSRTCKRPIDRWEAAEQRLLAADRAIERNATLPLFGGEP